MQILFVCCCCCDGGRCCAFLFPADACNPPPSFCSALSFSYLLFLFYQPTVALDLDDVHEHNSKESRQTRVLHLLRSCPLIATRRFLTWHPIFYFSFFLSTLPHPQLLFLEKLALIGIPRRWYTRLGTRPYGSASLD